MRPPDLQKLEELLGHPYSRALKLLAYVSTIGLFVLAFIAATKGLIPNTSTGIGLSFTISGLVGLQVLRHRKVRGSYLSFVAVIMMVGSLAAAIVAVLFGGGAFFDELTHALAGEDQPPHLNFKMAVDALVSVFFFLWGALVWGIVMVGSIYTTVLDMVRIDDTDR